MHALPPAPAPAPRRQVFVGTALACAAGASMMGGMLALWMRFREVAINGPDHRWLPKGITIPEVPSNVMLIAMLPICVFAQWAVYSAKRNDRPHAGLALGLVGLLGVAFINAQAFIWATMGLPIADGSYSVLFYAVTGVMTVLAVIGVTFSVVTAFRYLGGRTADRELVSAHALYWYSFSVVYSMLWFVVYVTK
ncbi:MAG: cytochrome c oxidase subunit 3 [Ilumatobacteraceae bacterium]